MSKHVDTSEGGFSAVELLITLFIGALFLISGTQIYSFIFSNGTESGQTARASNLAYELLKDYETSTFEQGTCSASTDSNPPTPDTHDLSITSKSIVVECPFAGQASNNLKNISKVTVTISYKTGSSTRSVKHATYMY